MITNAGTHTIKKENEDVYGVTRYGAFVMDGASALEQHSFCPAENDVVWMVKWWEQYLKAHLDELERPLQCIIEKGVIAFNEAFSMYKPVELLSQLEKVSASIGIIRMHDKHLECFVLGDVEISLRHKDGKLEIVTDERIKRLDAQVIQLMNQNRNRENECVFKDFTASEWALLKNNRMKINTEDGYYILSHDVKAIKKAIYKVYPLTNLESCLLSSDGISPLDRFYTRLQLMDKIKNIGLLHLFEQLRALERDDKVKVNLQRLKTHDDATAIFLEFNENDVNLNRGDAN
jgi:hypothetical protein